MRTAWPSQADYIMALQDPPSAFIDPSLQLATVEADSVLRLPKPRSGQMASVYKVFDGPKTWAVRCFNFASEERADRYRAISNFLASNSNRYTVGFEYAQDGIIVASRPYPIVKMEWVEGDLLHTYIAKHLDAPKVLHALARAWVEMTRDVHALQIAHGDLQHGNVLVTPGGELKLIDYDGMFVPEFAGLPSLEDGHPNYQHPCRQSHDFGPQLDNFSAWVIFLSITALARDRSVWGALRFGDDCLALRRADYVRPSASAAFALLEATSDPEVGKIARFLRSMLSHEPQSLPALESCAHFVSASGMESATGIEHGPDRQLWRLAPLASEPLAAGVLSEPFEPRCAAAPAVTPTPATSKLQRMIVRAAGGVLASVAGYWGFRDLGFATDQYIAIVSLAWVLAAIMVLATRDSKGPRDEP